MGLAGEIEIISFCTYRHPDNIYGVDSTGGRGTLFTFVLQRETWQCQNVKVKFAAFSFPEFCRHYPA